MSDYQPDRLRVLAERRARQANRSRVRQFAAIITTSGYALLAGGAWEPLLSGKKMGVARALALVFGLAMLALSIYLQPLAEKPDE